MKQVSIFLLASGILFGIASCRAADEAPTEPELMEEEVEPMEVEEEVPSPLAPVTPATDDDDPRNRVVRRVPEQI